MIIFNSTDYNNPNKHYTDVKVLFDREGNITPLSMTYDDREFEVDRITDVRPAASLKSGGAGIPAISTAKKHIYFLRKTSGFMNYADKSP